MSRALAPGHPRAQSQLLSLSQHHFPGLGRKCEWELKYFSIKRYAQNELLLFLPTADPFTVGAEQDPPSALGISFIQLHRAEAVFADEFQQFRRVLLKRPGRGFFRFLLLWMPLHFESDFVIKCFGVGLNFFRKIIGIERGLYHLEMLHECKRDVVGP